MRIPPLPITVLVASAILVGGCVDGDPTSVFVVGNASLDDECMVQEDSLLVSGLLDTASGSGYVMFPVVNNQIRERPTNLGTDPGAVHFDTAEVVIYGDASGAVVQGPYSVPASGFIPSASDPTTPGVGSVTVPAIPASVAQALQGLGSATVQVGVTLFGETNGQLDVETEEWRYLIQLCNGCRACFDAENLDTVCTPGQDSDGYRTSACPAT